MAKQYYIVWILLLGLVLRLFNLNQSFWLDEAAQVIESARPLSQQLSIAGDFQPPLFHLVLHAWLYVSHKEIWVRLLPVFFSIATLYIVYWLCLRMFGKQSALIASFLLSIAPFHIWYSQEVRPYALAVLLGVLATYFLYEKRYVWYVLSVVAGLYTMYMMPFLFIGHFLWILLFRRDQWKKFCLSSLGALLLFAPWIPFFLEQFSIGTSLTTTLPGWSTAVSSSTLRSLPLIFTKFALGRISIDNAILYGAIVGVLALGWSWLLWLSHKQHAQGVRALMIWAGVAIFCAFGISLFVPILAPQRVLFTLPFFYIIAAVGIGTRRKMGRICILGVFVCISVYALWNYSTNVRFQREQWRQAVAYVEGQANQQSLVVFVFPDPFAPWQWYEQRIVDSVGIAPQFVITDTDLQKIEPVVVQRSKIFLFSYLTDLTDPDKKTADFLRRQGFIETAVVDFPGVGFIHIYETLLA